MKRPFRFTTLLLLSAATSAMAQEPAMAEKLDKILRHPGDYSQVCDAMGYPMPAPIPGFRPIVHGEAFVSEKNIAFLKKNRAEILSAVSAKLQAIDLTVAAKPQPLDPAIPKEEADVDPRGVDPACYSTVLLQVVEETDGYEAFPALMALEEKFHTLLVAAEKDAKAPLPVVDGAEGAGIYASNLEENQEDEEKQSEEQKAGLDRKRKVFKAQAAHRDILALFVRVMRKQGFVPMLSSDLEKTYGKLMKDKWANHEDFKQYKRAADIPADMRNGVKFDPIHKVAYSAWSPVEVPYSEETRRMVLDLTRKFVSANAAKSKAQP